MSHQEQSAQGTQDAYYPTPSSEWQAFLESRITSKHPDIDPAEARIIANAQRLRKGDTITVGAALKVGTKHGLDHMKSWVGLCGWCIDKAWANCQELVFTSVPDGGWCSRCGVYHKDDVLIARNQRKP